MERPFPDIADDDLFVKIFTNEEPTLVDATEKTGVELAMSGAGKVTGGVAIGRYRKEPATSVRLSTGTADGGLGSSPLKYIAARVDGFDKGQATITIHYQATDLGKTDPKSLLIAYFDGQAWRKVDKIEVFTGANSVRGSIDISALTKGPIFALAGEGSAATAAPTTRPVVAATVTVVPTVVGVSTVEPNGTPTVAPGSGLPGPSLPTEVIVGVGATVALASLVYAATRPRGTRPRRRQ